MTGARQRYRSSTIDHRPSTSTRCTKCGRSSAALRCAMMDVMESIRLDRWLWAVRLAKTRPDAAAACRGGHVRVNDRPAKPSTTVSPGDEVRARVGDVTRIVEVVRVIQKRVGAADAVTCYLDRTPVLRQTPPVPVAIRDRGAGRPTKRDRRILDRLRAGRA
jgi:ribosome-associated heat shock protein Hsp15